MEWWIKLHKKILEWWRYTDNNTKSLMLHLILKASTKDTTRKWIEIKKWEVIVGRKSLSKELWLSEQGIRTSISKLKSTNEITSRATNKFTIITVVKYLDYQWWQVGKQPTEQPTNQPTSNQQATTSKEYKNIITNTITNNTSNLWKSLDIEPDSKNSKNFDTFWKQFPHARSWSRKEAQTKYNSHYLTEKELFNELELLKLKIKHWIENPKYVKACQRWIEWITKTDGLIVDDIIYKIISELMKKTFEDRKDEIDNLTKIYWFDKIREITDKRNKQNNKWITLLLKK
jgi:hypothetical protein